MLCFLRAEAIEWMPIARLSINEPNDQIASGEVPAHRLTGCIASHGTHVGEMPILKQVSADQCCHNSIYSISQTSWVQMLCDQAGVFCQDIEDCEGALS